MTMIPTDNLQWENVNLDNEISLPRKIKYFLLYQKENKFSICELLSLRVNLVFSRNLGELCLTEKTANFKILIICTWANPNWHIFILYKWNFWGTHEILETLLFVILYNIKIQHIRT